VIIRRAQQSDAESVWALLGQMGSAFEPDRGAFDRNYPPLLDSADELLLVAEDAGEVVGYALTVFSTLLYTNGVSGQLQELVVDEGRRQLGAGRALVEAVEAECITRGAAQLVVATRRAAGFYDRLGYYISADYLKRTFD
jgi:ribosomal protein S18 acetylase RimI-like enzyme